MSGLNTQAQGAVGRGIVAELDLRRGAVSPNKMGVDIRNETGGTLAVGDLVYLSSYSAANKRFLVAKADANGDATSATYIVAVAIPTARNGRVYREWLSAANLNTGGSAVGDPVYLSTVAGGWTLTRTNQIVGRVVVVNAATGQVRFDLASFPALPGALSGAHLGEVAQSAAGAISVPNLGALGVLMLTVPAGVTADLDWTLPAGMNIRVLDAWLVKTAAVGGGAGTIQLKNAANALTNAMSIDVADQTVVRAGTIDDAQHRIAGAGTLRITRTRTASADESAIVYVSYVRVV